MLLLLYNLRGLGIVCTRDRDLYSERKTDYVATCIVNVMNEMYLYSERDKWEPPVQ